MGTAQGSKARARLRAENVGGIDETEVVFRSGVTVLTGRNATNRSSFLQAVMAALGSDQASLKGDADEGRVELSVDGETYSRSMERRDDQVVFGGEPYTDEATLADLFAFLLESNGARRAVARGEDLREIIVRPVDTGEIQAEIEALESRKREIDAELENRELLADELASVEAERAALADDIQEKREELAAEQDRIEAVDAGFEETRERKAELEAKLETLRERRSDREDVRFRLETERETAAGIRDELEDVEAFNDHTAAILDALDDDNVERIWLERVEREIREGRRTLTRGFFDLHVIRRADGGAVYEDTVQHLSESEREVTGLVFALAGYLVHEVHEMCPFILLDSIEALDSGRIATLVEYLAEYADYLVVALLPEDAEAVDDRHRGITEI
jgi:DNA repair ATPase RecN